MDCKSDTELHSFDVALDRSVNNRAFVVGDDGTYLAEVRVFPFRGDDWYVAYLLTSTGEKDSYRMSCDRICNRSQLIVWVLECGLVKSRVGAEKFLSQRIWKADITSSY